MNVFQLWCILNHLKLIILLVFFSFRYFTSIPLLQTLESYGAYGCVWNDAKPVRSFYVVHIVSTTSDPLENGPAQRRVRGGSVIIIQRPPAVEHYQQHYYDVDRTHQCRSKCPVGRLSKKLWKYLINYVFEISLINTFLLWFETPGTRKPTKHFSMVDCNLSIAEKRFGFSSRKRALSCGRGVAGFSVANISRHISTKLTRPRGRCKQCKKNGRSSDTFLVVAFVMYICVEGLFFRPITLIITRLRNRFI